MADKLKPTNAVIIYIELDEQGTMVRINGSTDLRVLIRMPGKNCTDHWELADVPAATTPYPIDRLLIAQKFHRDETGVWFEMDDVTWRISNTTHHWEAFDGATQIPFREQRPGDVPNNTLMKEAAAYLRKRRNGNVPTNHD